MVQTSCGDKVCFWALVIIHIPCHIAYEILFCRNEVIFRGHKMQIRRNEIIFRDNKCYSKERYPSPPWPATILKMVWLCDIIRTQKSYITQLY